MKPVLPILTAVAVFSAVNFLQAQAPSVSKISPAPPVPVITPSQAPAAPTPTPSLSAAPSQPPVALTPAAPPNQGLAAPTPTVQTTTTQAPPSPIPDPYRGHYIDISAAMFGWLSVVFGLLTLGISIFVIVLSIKGVSQFRHILRQIEGELRQKVETMFRERLNNVVESEIKPKVQEIVNNELSKTLEEVRDRAHAEMTRAVTELDARETLINEIVALIQSRSSQTSAIDQNEF